jgi:hypothetical protein
MLLVPKIDPLLNLLVRDAFAALKRDYGPPDAGNLPFVEIVVERLSGEVRSGCAQYSWRAFLAAS